MPLYAASKKIDFSNAGKGFGIAFADYDRDGRLDICVAKSIHFNKAWNLVRGLGSRPLKSSRRDHYHSVKRRLRLISRGQ